MTRNPNRFGPQLPKGLSDTMLELLTSSYKVYTCTSCGKKSGQGEHTFLVDGKICLRCFTSSNKND